MRHEIVVFLGPSLDPDSAGRLLTAEYLPPAKRGDITDAVARGARIITLIDGVFFQVKVFPESSRSFQANEQIFLRDREILKAFQEILEGIMGIV